ncbi:hypothetical protein [Caudoviricetes sp.]|nr:hypothetical protein [Caudoviricetes sp.]
MLRLAPRLTNFVLSRLGGGKYLGGDPPYHKMFVTIEIVTKRFLTLNWCSVNQKNHLFLILLLTNCSINCTKHKNRLKGKTDGTKYIRRWNTS